MKNDQSRLPLYLASTSDRRKEILSLLGMSFEVCAVDADETFVGADPADNAARIAKLKAESARHNHRNAIIISADTIVHAGNALLGKPSSRKHAREMLEVLSGNIHQVVTGFCVYDGQTGNFECGYDSTSVQFSVLDEHAIEWYLDTGEWESVAGAYRIQGSGSCLIQGISGSYHTVMGLPIHRIYGILRQINFI